jgi:hypothetical protein
MSWRRFAADMICAWSGISLCVCLALLCVPSTTFAQSIDLTAGGGMTFGGRHDYVSRATVVVAFTHAPLQSGSVTHAFSVVARPQLDHSEKCRTQPDGQCAPRTHGSLQAGVLSGVETRKSYVSYRGAVGPALHFGRTQGLGAQATAGVALGRRLAVVMAARGALVVLRDRETLKLGSIEFGLRYSEQ